MSGRIVATLLVLSVSCAARDSRGALRVYKGKPDSSGEFPYIVLLQKTKPIMRICTGSLIATNWVLTASHCFKDDPPFYTIVRYGDFSLPPNKTKSYSDIIKTFRFPTVGERDDIGLLLVEKILNKPIAKLPALDYKTLFGLPVKYAGFGVTNEAQEPIPSVLLPLASDLQFPPRVGEGVLIPCGPKYIIGHEICVAAKCSNKKQGARKGDSGGPIMYDGRIVGVVKSGYDEDGLAIHITPVSLYIEWIRNVMRSN